MTIFFFSVKDEAVFLEWLGGLPSVSLLGEPAEVCTKGQNYFQVTYLTVLIPIPCARAYSKLMTECPRAFKILWKFWLDSKGINSTDNQSYFDYPRANRTV